MPFGDRLERGYVPTLKNAHCLKVIERGPQNGERTLCVKERESVAPREHLSTECALYALA